MASARFAAFVVLGSLFAAAAIAGCGGETSDAIGSLASARGGSSSAVGGSAAVHLGGAAGENGASSGTAGVGASSSGTSGASGSSSGAGGGRPSTGRRGSWRTSRSKPRSRPSFSAVRSRSSSPTTTPAAAWLASGEDGSCAWSACEGTPSSGELLSGPTSVLGSPQFFVGADGGPPSVGPLYLDSYAFAEAGGSSFWTVAYVYEPVMGTNDPGVPGARDRISCETQGVPGARDRISPREPRRARRREDIGPDSQAFRGAREDIGPNSQAFRGAPEDIGPDSQAFRGAREDIGPRARPSAAPR